MRTYIVLDDQLVQEALALSKVKTIQELVEQALREFVTHRNCLDVRELKGMGNLREDYDYKSLRAGKGES